MPSLLTHTICNRLQVRLTVVRISITSPETTQERRDLKAARDLSLAEVTAYANAGQLLIRWAFIKEKMETISRKKGTHFLNYLSRDILTTN